MARHRSSKPQALPRALVRLIHAARQSRTDSEGSDITGAAEALNGVLRADTHIDQLGEFPIGLTRIVGS